MPGLHSTCSFLTSIALVGGLLFALAQAQDPAVADAPTFAPGVLTTIEPEVRAADTVVTHDLMELRADVSLQHEPATNTESRTLYAMAEGVDFRREVWCLELSFKPLRMIEVDIPQPSGKMQRKLIWYLVYRVRNTGAGLTPMEEADGTFTTQAKATEEIRFVPEFVLASQDRNRAGQPVRKEYLDRVLPAALVAIQRREMPRGELLNSAQMSEQLLKAESGRQMGGLWGVAIWEDVDPQIDFFSVYVRGLTNAYDWQDAPADFRLGGPLGQGRRFTHKVLQLNFWRPGDAYEEDEREIRYGAAPKMAEFYGVAEGVAYQWVYR